MGAWCPGVVCMAKRNPLEDDEPKGEINFDEDEDEDEKEDEPDDEEDDEW